MTVPVLEQKFKDHTVPNAIVDVHNSALPLGSKDVHMQPIRNLAITIQVLDEKEEKVIETITGKADSGSVSLDSNSLVRRTGSLTMSIDPDLFPEPGSLMWFGNIIRIYAGLYDLTKSDNQLNFLLGTFWIDEGSYSIDSSGENLTFSLSDKMTKYDEYELEYPLVIPPGVEISEAIRLVMEHVGETNFGRLDQLNSNLVVPYTLEYGIGQNAIQIIEELRDMYMDCVCGYDLMGRFEFKQLSVQRQQDTEEPKWRFDSVSKDRSDLTVSFAESYNLKNIRNRIVVYGGTSDVTGMTPSAEVKITDPNSPFNVDAIGVRKKIFTEDDLFTNDQCASFARYQAWKMSNFQEVANISTVPIYILDAHDIIEITHPYTKFAQRYMVDSFEIGLGVDSDMSIKAHKMYYVSLEYGENVRELVTHFTKGIANWGWLSIPEQRIKDTLGIIASGDATLTVRFVEDDLGGHQASVTSYATTKNQTLLIDLTDFAELDPTSDSGDNNRSTGDYADRVLGHEMLHAVENDYLGYERTINLPMWFREGMAEFLHGAKERYQGSYHDLNSTDKKAEMIKRAEQLLNNAWVGDNNDYAVSYLILAAIFRLQTQTQWLNMYPRLRSETNLSINFLAKLLPDLGNTNEAIIDLIVSEMNSMSGVWAFLNDTTDTDTGSIAGIHFMNMYGVPLTADTVFNNTSATVDSIGFDIRIEK